jgi:DNA-binding MarR family transcriptional regulator
MSNELQLAEGEHVQASAVSWALRQVLVAAASVNLVLARELGLSLNDLAALDHLLVHQPLGPAELGHRLGMRPASATALVDRLEAAGHVQRRPHPTDRRRLAIEVTSHARSRTAEAMRPLIADLDTVAAGLSAEANDTVLDYLRRIELVLRRHDTINSADAAQ